MKTMTVSDLTAARHREVAIRDITAEEAAEWVAEEFHALGDAHEIQARINLEIEIIEANAHKAGEFPMTQLAHEQLLVELRAEFERQTSAMVSEPRTLH
ncbi:hypothetical protein G6L37_00565 [Agrobacterium rubi]|nr:hypothetical protein [Agrobacterium rubi]NTF23882.1 hypothetical protein [Agrobacterium rubi]